MGALIMFNLAYLAIGFFAIAAAFGLIVFIQLACERPTLKPVVILHGLFAVSGLGLLVTYLVNHYHKNLLIGVIILVLAALGGLTLLSFDLKKKAPPKLLLFLHPLAAIIGLIFLVWYTFFSACCN